MPDILRLNQEDGIYQVECIWKQYPGKKRSGHTFTFVHENGQGYFYDPQTNAVFKNLQEFKMYSSEVSPKFGYQAFKTDGLCVDTKRIKDVIRQHKADTVIENALKASKGGTQGFRPSPALREKRKALRNSGELPLRQRQQAANLDKGWLRSVSETRKNLIEHCRNEEELAAAKFIWNNPQELHFVRHSPLGEGKAPTNPTDIANLQKKIDRGVTSYNVYKFAYNGQTWEAKMEVYHDATEQFYHIKKASL